MCIITLIHMPDAVNWASATRVPLPRRCGRSHLDSNARLAGGVRAGAVGEREEGAGTLHDRHVDDPAVERR